MANSGDPAETPGGRPEERQGERQGQRPGQRLRALLGEGQLIVAPGVFDGISAHLVRQMGFRAAYLTGAGTAASGFGLPDIGLVTGSEMAERAAMMAEAVGDLPLIADVVMQVLAEGGATLETQRGVHLVRA